MPRRISNQLKFRLERLVLRGAHYRLMVIAALIGLIFIVAGTIIAVFDELFGPGGAEIVFRQPRDYGVSGDVSFEGIRSAAARRGETAIGVRPRDGRIERSGGVALNPSRDCRFELAAADEIIALTTY